MGENHIRPSYRDRHSALGDSGGMAMFGELMQAGKLGAPRGGLQRCLPGGIAKETRLNRLELGDTEDWGACGKYYRVRA